jgi:ABC-type nitrate/sulfonate/bicarbonate transport system substrate-binding protein
MTKQFAQKLLLISFVILLNLALLIGFACKRSNTETDVVTLRIAYRPKALADITPVIIKEMNMQRPGLHVELVPVPTPTAAVQQLAAGQVDAIAGLTLAAVLEFLSNDEIKIMAYYHQLDVSGEGWVSIVGNRILGIKSLTDLAAKPVASLPTDQARWLLRRILRAAGIPEDQIDIVNYNPLTPLAGLEAKEHAAIFGLEPAIAEAISRGNVILASGPISHYLYDNQPVIVSASVITSKFVQDQPVAFKQFQELIDEAVVLSHRHPDRVRTLFTKREYGELPAAVASRLYLPVMAKPSATGRSTAEKFVDDLVQSGLLTTRVNIDPLFPQILPAN